MAINRHLPEKLWRAQVSAAIDGVGAPGGVSDGDKGDIVVSSSGAVWTLDAAVSAKLVTNGDSHDHSGGDGAQIAYSSLSSLPTLGNAAAKNTGTAAGTVAAGDDSRFTDARTPTSHDHSANKLAQANTHESPDTDSATTSLHHTIGAGANQAAAGNHTHSYQASDAQLTDLAALSYTGNGLKVVRVNTGETAFELATLAGGDVTGQASSVDNEIALFSSTTGKVIKRATTTGLLKATSGVIAAASSGTDYAPATSGTGLLKGNGSGGFSTATAGTDYPRPYTLVATLASDQATGANTTPVTLTGLVWTFEANAVDV